MARPKPLRPAVLRRRCARAQLRFRTTDQLADLDEVLGQPRAVEALSFGIGIRQPGFNMFAYGPAETGLRTVVRQSISDRAADEPVPNDWVYVFNFEATHRPRAITLPAGRGRQLKADLERLIEDLKSAIPAAFETEEYRARAQVIEDGVKETHQAALHSVEERARGHDIALVRTPVGMGFAPMRGDEVLSPEVFAKLPASEKAAVAARISQLQEELQAALRELPRMLHAAHAKIKELNKEVAAFAVGHLIDTLRAKYQDIDELVVHFGQLEDDVIDNAGLFRETPYAPGAGQADGAAPGPVGAPGGGTAHAASLRRYRVNLFVDHGGNKGAPIVYEPDPSYQNLVGRIEHMAELGALVTDFSLIKPGALHLANGGYLIVDARKILTSPYAWEGLKEALRAAEVRIESLGQMIGMVSTVSVEPERIPVRVKVVMFGEPILYYLLRNNDPEFAELFKVAVDFDDRMERDDETIGLYARLIATQVRNAGLRALDRDAVGLVIEESARMVGDSERLSTLTREVGDLLAEADYCAQERGAGLVGAGDVRAAVAGRRRRADRVSVRMREQIERGTVLIETNGAAIGQINGLSVIQMGDFAFGRPARITARVRMGRGQVIDIEREVKLGGPTHSKGVLILSNFLAARFSLDTPLSLSASLAFEQSYGGIDGDSASSAELYALLSALAEVPIDQALAVTGSVNQFGEVQAIGGVNEKIEGFFDLCAARGLTGGQGVLIPASNVKHLMLREDVVEAARTGRFAVYPIRSIDQGIALLTGVAAGKRSAKGAYPKDSINRRVVDRLRAFTEQRRRFVARPRNDEDSSGES